MKIREEDFSDSMLYTEELKGYVLEVLEMLQEEKPCLSLLNEIRKETKKLKMCIETGKEEVERRKQASSFSEKVNLMSVSTLANLTAYQLENWKHLFLEEEEQKGD